VAKLSSFVAAGVLRAPSNWFRGLYGGFYISFFLIVFWRFLSHWPFILRWCASVGFWVHVKSAHRIIYHPDAATKIEKRETKTEEDYSIITNRRVWLQENTVHVAHEAAEQTVNR